MGALISPGTAYEQKKPDRPEAGFYARHATALPLLESSKKPPLPPELDKIAWCESRNRQYDGNGRPLRGENYYDVGKYQINIKIWGEEAKKLGHDIFTEEGNEAMALELYRRHDTEPWVWSRSCWDK